MAITVNINIKGEKLEMTPDELRALRDQIDSLLGKETVDRWLLSPYAPDPYKPIWFYDQWTQPTYGPMPITCSHPNSKTV